MTKNGKKGVLILLGATVVLGVMAASSSKKAKAAPLPEHDEQSPGWPQPDEQDDDSGPPQLPQPSSLPTIPGMPSVPLPAMPSMPSSSNDTEDHTPDAPPIPANVPVPNLQIPARPPEHAAELPSTVSEDTAAMVQRLLAAEATPNWKRTDPVVTAWQKSRDLVADGKFGMKTALAVADEMGTVPLVRFWPKGTYLESGIVDEYRAALAEKANAAPRPRKDQLLAAMDREQGQGFARNVPAATQLIILEGMNNA